MHARTVFDPFCTGTRLLRWCLQYSRPSHVVAARGPYTFLWGVWARQRPGVGAFMCVTVAYPLSSSTLSTISCHCCYRVVVPSWSFWSPMRGVFEDCEVYAVYERTVCYVCRVVLLLPSFLLELWFITVLCLPPSDESSSECGRETWRL